MSGWRYLFFVMYAFVSLSAMPKIHYDFVVAQDGTGDFTTVQAAINAVPDFRKKETTVFIKEGVYKEKLILPASKNLVTLVGASAEKTIITNDDFAAKKNRFGEEMGTTGSSGVFIFGDDFSACDITFENSAGPVGQAVAVRVDGDRVSFYRCRFLGSQDTLYPHGTESRQYYKNCYIEGTIDFIFGSSTAVFDDCDIECKSSGYITAASTLAQTQFGFVFLKCRIFGDVPSNSVYLGRPWRLNAKTVFIDCELGDLIKNEGWHNWNKVDAEQTVLYSEYNNSGIGAKKNNRVPWSKQLTKQERASYTLNNIFNGWLPKAEGIGLDNN